MNGEELARLVEKLRSKRGGWTKKELAEIGVGWPPKKGWRKRIIQTFEREKRSRSNPKPATQNGFIVRKTGSGRIHYWIGGQALCRSIPTGDRYVFVAERPEGPPMCSMCSKLIKTDPENRRESKPVGDRDFYSSWEWKKVRFETIKRWGAKCMCCGSEERIVVDHIKPRRIYPYLELVKDNLQVLCDDCNKGKSWDDETDFRPKDSGEVIELTLVHDADKRL